VNLIGKVLFPNRPRPCEDALDADDDGDVDNADSIYV